MKTYSEYLFTEGSLPEPVLVMPDFGFYARHLSDLRDDAGLFCISNGDQDIYVNTIEKLLDLLAQMVDADIQAAHRIMLEIFGLQHPDVFWTLLGHEQGGYRRRFSGDTPLESVHIYKE